MSAIDETCDCSTEETDAYDDGYGSGRSVGYDEGRMDGIDESAERIDDLLEFVNSCRAIEHDIFWTLQRGDALEQHTCLQHTVSKLNRLLKELDDNDRT